MGGSDVMALYTSQPVLNFRNYGFVISELITGNLADIDALGNIGNIGDAQSNGKLLCLERLRMDNRCSSINI